MPVVVTDTEEEPHHGETGTEEIIGPIAFVVLLLLATIAGTPASAASVRLDPATGAGNLLAATSVLRDPTGRMTLAEVRRADRRFVPFAALEPDLHVSAFSPGTLWFRLKPRVHTRGRWVLTTSFEVDRSRLYFVADRGAVRRSDFGMLVPFSKRSLPYLENAVLVPQGAMQSGTLYVQTIAREDRFGTLGLRPMRWEAVDGRTSSAEQTIPEVFLCGIVGALGLFNLLLALTLREVIYVRYGSAMAAFALYQCVECGAAWRWLWPNASLPYDPTAYACYLVYLALVVGFAGALLDLRTTQPTVWNLIRASYALVVAFDVTNAIWPNLPDWTRASGAIETAVNAVFLATILASGVIAWRTGVRGAGSYTIAFAGVTIGLLVGVGADNGLIAESPLTDALPGIGVAWEAFFLALAVSKRIERLRGERDALATVAFLDTLTGIPNRRAFERRFEDVWRHAVRDTHPLAIVLIDVDHFKEFNDTNGHLAGDDVLTRVARAIARSVRGGDDLVARYGGEEFMVLLPHCDARGAERVAEAVRLAVEELAVTVSAGVASIVPGRDDEPAALVASADRALYRAKRDGRNRVVSSTAVA